MEYIILRILLYYYYCIVIIIPVFYIHCASSLYVPLGRLHTFWCSAPHSLSWWPLGSEPSHSPGLSRLSDDLYFIPLIPCTQDLYISVHITSSVLHDCLCPCNPVTAYQGHHNKITKYIMEYHIYWSTRRLFFPIFETPKSKGRLILQ